MAAFLLSIGSAAFWSKAGYVLLAIGLIGDLAVIFIPSRKHVLEKSLAALFTLTILAGVVVGHMGDDAILQAVERRAIKAEERFADRILSDERVSQIGAALLPFAGQQFTINTYWNDKEPTAFAKRIGDSALIAVAHWQFVRPTGILVARISGIIVYVASDADERTMKSASALVSALKAAGVDAVIDQDSLEKTLVSITVGIRP